MLFIAILEGITALIGSGIFTFIDTLLPDLDLNLDTPDLNHAGYFTRFLSWIRVGSVPAVILLILFLTFFGLFGLSIQLCRYAYWKTFLPPVWVSLPTFFLAMLMVRILGGIIAKIIPKDETDAVSEDSFVGRVAVITLGQARKGKPAQARLKDSHGQTHYVMVEPDSSETTFTQGQTVLLIQRKGAVFEASNDIPDWLISE
jgi:hypothetical protein